MNKLIDSLKAVAEPTRLRLMNLCSKTELSASDLTKILGQSQPRISRHLKVLSSNYEDDLHRLCLVNGLCLNTSL